ncbi:MAG TPA: hypothetical protein VJP85_02055 [Candidatus Baltobacteraceae bacterium]|nr:hypothetical protein [Candidatus Baltobacteraceae bacterium]
MPLERRIQVLQAVALAAILPVLVIGWMHMAFNSFAGTRWYDPVTTLGIAVNVAAQFAALRYIRMRARRS